MPYGKKYRDFLLPPFHPGDGISDERWEAIFGTTMPKGLTADNPNPCNGCAKYQKRGKTRYCAFGETYGTERCNEIKNTPQFATALYVK